VNHPPAQYADELAELALITAGATFLLAAIAGIIAIAAYHVSIQEPDLRIRISSPDGPMNTVSLTATLHQDDPGRADLPHGEGKLPQRILIYVANFGKASARSPAVSATFVGFEEVRPVRPWVHPDPRYLNTAQWDGGSDYAIHGGWRRQLPSLQIAGGRVRVPAPDGGYAIDVVAEGFQRTERFPLQLSLRDPGGCQSE
jgi:hypothetical protein